jgi:response regulator RpfG family c-di-GMP phosphodiesterase
VGKIGIPDAILEKQDALDDAEWTFMRQHTVLGERILAASPALRGAGAIVRSTHERWDGHGYPDELGGETIPLAARIIAVCDAYAVMTTDRCYRKRMSDRAACDELRRHAGRQFDPKVVDAVLAELQCDVAIPQAGSAAPSEPARSGFGATSGEIGTQRVEQAAAYLRSAVTASSAPSAHVGVKPS